MRQSRLRSSRLRRKSADTRSPEPQAVPLAANVQTVTVTPDENGMRVDRFLEARFPGLSFSHIQRIIRKGELRVNGKRTEPKDRLEAGQSVRIPPLRLDAPKPRRRASRPTHKDRAFLKSITLYEDDDVMVLNKPMGLAVQGGSGTTRHIDGMLGAMRRRRRAASAARAPARQGHGRLSAGRQDALRRGGARQNLPLALGAQDLLGAGRRRAEAEAGPHLDLSGQGRTRGRFADAGRRTWRGGRKPRPHLLCCGRDGGPEACLAVAEAGHRPHPSIARPAAHIGHPIVGDPKYFDIENWEMPGGMQNKLHLLARRIVRAASARRDRSTSPRRCRRTCSKAGICSALTPRYDPIEEAPEGELAPPMDLKGSAAFRIFGVSQGLPRLLRHWMKDMQKSLMILVPAVLFAGAGLRPLLRPKTAMSFRFRSCSRARRASGAPGRRQLRSR